mmetsp:Transcript_2302/g.3408  ORF Transcript_2302/g.3408 Transcript_2302/m.3408 type:complete len:448 (-) Transcript_2302:199-1542(-)|eukprot:CAMPEP_0194208202 /NCGR_PEP_ID=MMETSP0156-20130528/6711_1 /TAXON_ID=33649 /ORGANISM="Thalassionema nitzschioides, Strain L26-B" /LENGTH=447 /DNA_ID=CAMNT_0038935113 /DNA_START=207 /DNA_END=1550 /DNA_ORIENTATION=-
MVFNFRRRKSKNATQETVEKTTKKSPKQTTSRLRILGKGKGAPKSGDKNLQSDASASTSRAASGGKKTKRSLRKKRSEFNTPLGTIEEGNDGIEAQATGETAKTEDSNDTQPMPNVAILNARDGETELVVGDVPDDIKRRLFAHEESIEEEPFDAQQAIRREDPHILEVMKSESNEQEERQEKEENKGSRYLGEFDDIAAERSRHTTFDPYSKKSEAAKSVGNLAKNFMNAINCNDATNLMDTMCVEPEPKKTRRIYYNDVFAFRFIQEAIHEGIPMLYHHPPKNPVDNDWTGQSMTMFIRPGDYRGQIVSQPKLEWSTVDGGWSRLTGTSVKVISVSLLDIHSIMDEIEEEDELDENFCFFSITTMGGNVHLLECSDENERDRVVTGIRNVLSQLSKGIVAGDGTVTKDLYTNTEEAGELPLRTHEQIFKVTSHDFLDSLGNSIES